MTIPESLKQIYYTLKSKTCSWLYFWDKNSVYNLPIQEFNEWN